MQRGLEGARHAQNGKTTGANTRRRAEETCKSENKEGEDARHRKWEED